MNLEDIKKVCVIGLGTMGPGLAQVFAQAGYQVRGFDLDAKAADKSGMVVKRNMENLVEMGLLTGPEANEAERRITYHTTLGEALAGAHLILETVSENRQIKTQVYTQVAELAEPEALLWSNTSTLNIYELIPQNLTKRSIIAHWFSPPHILPLVEIVKGPDTGDELTAITVELLTAMKKIPVVMDKFVPGFAINRIQRIIGREVFHLLDGGYISPEDLDLAVKASLAPRMMLLGLVQRMDFTGLDLSARNLLDEQFFDPPVNDRPVSLQSKIDRNDLGVKTGKGFFDYSDRELPQILADRDRYLLRIMQGVQFCLDNRRLL